MTKQSYLAIGQMSGTSLDGLDLAAARFTYHNQQWQYAWVVSETLPYSNIWEDRLRKAPELSASKLMHLHQQYGDYLGRTIANFISNYQLQPDIIACHGHTVFHRPDLGFTTQIGAGWPIVHATGCTVANDFRAADVALGGQGAPLVPIGDKLLFGNFAYCLNLGGFSNVSFSSNGQRRAFDICPVNLALNTIARKLGHAYDNNGEAGRKGKINQQLLAKLDALPYYHLSEQAKSLGKEWLDSEFMPLLTGGNLTATDTLATLYEHMARQIGKQLQGTPQQKTLVTGGGAFNGWLLEKMQAYTPTQLVVPDTKLVAFKEALIFAFMGVLRLRGDINCLASATGARRDCSCGTLHLP